jgi:hypothetical protein
LFTEANDGSGAPSAGRLRAAFPALREFRDSAIARLLTSSGGSTLVKQRRRDAGAAPPTPEQWLRVLLAARAACASPSACARLAWSLAAEADVQEGGGLSWRLAPLGARALAGAALWPWAVGGAPAALPCPAGAPPALAYPCGAGAAAWARDAVLAGFSLALLREGGDEGAFLGGAGGGALARLPRRVAALLGAGSPAAQRELVCRCLADAGGGGAPALVAAVSAEWWAAWSEWVDWGGWRARAAAGAAPPLPPPPPPPPLGGLPLRAVRECEAAEWRALRAVADALGEGAAAPRADALDGGAWLGFDGAGGGALGGGGGGGAPLLPWAPLLQPPAARGQAAAGGDVPAPAPGACAREPAPLLQPASDVLFLPLEAAALLGGWWGGAGGVHRWAVPRGSGGGGGERGAPAAPPPRAEPGRAASLYAPEGGAARGFTVDDQPLRVWVMSAWVGAGGDAAALARALEGGGAASGAPGSAAALTQLLLPQWPPPPLSVGWFCRAVAGGGDGVGEGGGAPRPVGERLLLLRAPAQGAAGGAPRAWTIWDPAWPSLHDSQWLARPLWDMLDEARAANARAAGARACGGGGGDGGDGGGGDDDDGAHSVGSEDEPRACGSGGGGAAAPEDTWTVLVVERSVAVACGAEAHPSVALCVLAAGDAVDIRVGDSDAWARGEVLSVERREEEAGVEDAAALGAGGSGGVTPSPLPAAPPGAPPARVTLLHVTAAARGDGARVEETLRLPLLPWLPLPAGARIAALGTRAPAPPPPVPSEEAPPAPPPPPPSPPRPAPAVDAPTPLTPAPPPAHAPAAAGFFTPSPARVVLLSWDSPAPSYGGGGADAGGSAPLSRAAARRALLRSNLAELLLHETEGLEAGAQAATAAEAEGTPAAEEAVAAASAACVAAPAGETTALPPEAGAPAARFFGRRPLLSSSARLRGGGARPAVAAAAAGDAPAPSFQGLLTGVRNVGNT